LGERTGFSASFLSQVELGQSSPSLASLDRICAALGLSLAELLAPSDSSPVLRRSRREAHRSDWSKATAESLVPAGSDDRLSAMLLKLEPGGRTGTTSYRSGTRVFAYCTDGCSTLVLREPEEEVQLESGDSLMLDGPRSFAWENRGDSSADLLVVVARVQ
ncbi:MAG TPA: XRE family transcriptional regulator, partial [Polyangiaceae bacterium]|nr:XRE family transcriptional regulator [Polyangiaceae bacterium]